MNNNKFLCVGLFPILAATLLLLAVTYYFEARDIEKRVKVSASEALQDNAYDWASIETHNRGRQVLVTGSPPNQENLDQALSLVDDAWGVYSVTHNGEILAAPELVDPTVGVSIAEETVRLSGTVASEAQSEALAVKAKQTFPGFKIVNNISVGENIKNLPGLGFMNGLRVFEEPTKIDAMLNGSDLKLSGYVPSKTSLDSTLTGLRDNFNGRVESNLKVNRSFCDTVVSNAQRAGKINFQTGKAVISPTSYDLLNSIASAVKRCPEVIYEVSGHTDSTGNAALNLKLSERRAASVVDYLVSAGLPAEQLKATGYGADRPIASNETEEGRSNNRRIEFTAYKQ